MDKEHPLAYSGSGKVYYHRHMASIMLGRWITSAEVVHHIDGDKTNNNLHNLAIMSAEDHASLHKPSEKVSLTCKVCGESFKLPKYKVKPGSTCSLKCKSINSRSPTCNITKEALEELIWRYPYTVVAGMIGLSDNGVRRRAASLGCLMPPPRFHLKSKTQRVEIASKFNISL